MPAPDANEPDANEQNTNRFQAILRSLDGTSSGRRKQKCSDILDPYLSSAHFFRLNYDLFAHFNMVLQEGMQAQFDPDWIDPDQDQSEEAQAIREHHLQVYQKFSSSIPNWNELVKNFETKAESLNEFLRAMENTANSARCDDTGSLKHNGLQYLLKDPAKDRFDPPILKTHGKAVRGWNHTATARLLCPARDIVEFDEDPHAYMDQVKSGQKKIMSKQWPSMFYDMSLYNPRNKKLGFLHGHAIVQGWRHIFTGPMSTLSKERTHRSSKPAKGKKHHLTEPGPRNIMYAAIQMYFVACNGESWTPEVSTMNLDDLYYSAVDLLETHADEQWVKDLLQFWKESVVLFFIAAYLIDCSSKTPGLVQSHPSKRRRVATNSTASDGEDDMDDFFGDDSEETQLEDRSGAVPVAQQLLDPIQHVVPPQLLYPVQHTALLDQAQQMVLDRPDQWAPNSEAGMMAMATVMMKMMMTTTISPGADAGSISKVIFFLHALGVYNCFFLDIERERSPLTPPSTSPVVSPTPARGRSHGRGQPPPSSRHGQGKRAGKR
ncbi:hypothetical protein F4604DRAFT_1923747 [Suillus subluteus]|nr:hypothetical protein F4604DRAFT_1923747 [Suillus subluteus]